MTQNRSQNQIRAFVNFTRNSKKHVLFVLLAIFILSSSIFVHEGAAFTLNNIDGIWSNARDANGIIPSCLKYSNSAYIIDENNVAYGRTGYSCPQNLNYDEQSGFGFDGNNGQINVNPGEMFKLGVFKHYNKKIYADSVLTDVDLEISLIFTDPVVTGAFTYTVNLEETDNTGNCKYPGDSICPDKVIFVESTPNQIFQLGGKCYTLQIVGFANCQNPENPINEFITEEDMTNSICLYGRLDESGPSLSIEKSTNDDDADVSPGPYIKVGDTVTWNYVVTNCGDCDLTNVSVIDDQGIVPLIQSGDDGDGILEPGETWIYSANGTAKSGQYHNKGTVNATDPQGNKINDDDDSHYFGIDINPGQSIDTMGYFYDQTTGQIIPGGMVSVSGPTESTVNIQKDGSDGRYSFTTSDISGPYIITVTCPLGYTLSPNCLPQSGFFGPRGKSEPIFLGAGENDDTGYLTSSACEDNPYYLSFMLNSGDPEIFNNNFPLVPLVNVTKVADKVAVSYGDRITYTITICNISPKPLFNVIVRDVIDRSVDIVSATPSLNDDCNWHFDVINTNDCVEITFVVKVPKQDLEFDTKHSITGEGFVRVANDYSTTFQHNVINNRAYVYSNGVLVGSDCENTTLLGAGTELSTREHGSGSYDTEELVKITTENMSIEMGKNVSATHNPYTLGLYRNRSITYNSKWNEEARAKNRRDPASMSEHYRYATSIDRDSHIKLDKNGSTMEINSEFNGSSHIGFLKTDLNYEVQDIPVFESREDYTGSFRTYQKVDEYGYSVTSEKSTEGTGFVVVDKRVKDSQRSYEHGTGSYDSKESINTHTNYMAKDLNVVYHPLNESLIPSVELNQDLKWEEGMWSKANNIWLTGERYSDIDQLNKDTVACGLNEMETEANFSGQARYRVILKDEIDLNEQYEGDYSIARRVLVQGVPKYDRPHLSIIKKGDIYSENVLKDHEDEVITVGHYTITLENDGNKALGPICVRDVFSQGAKYLDASVRPTDITDSYVNWTLTHLSIGDVSIIELWLDVTECPGKELVNRVMAWGGYRSDWICASNYTALEVDWLDCCAEDTVKASKVGWVNNSDQVWYKIEIYNGANSTKVATVTDQLSDGMILLDASVPFAAYQNGVVTWNLIDLAPFQIKSIEYRTEALRDGTFVNRAQVDILSVNGAVEKPIYAESIITIGELDGEVNAAIWQPPMWGFVYNEPNGDQGC